MGQLVSTQYIHSCSVGKSSEASAVVIKEKEVVIDEKTSVVEKVTDNLRVIANPKKRIWITKPHFRTHSGKKESELISHCDCYTVEDQYVKDELKKLLGLPPRRYMSLRDICDSPYIYGADIPIEALIRGNYEDAAKHTVTPLSKGFFDIEQSVLEDKRINAITVICDDTVYTGCLRAFMKKENCGVMIDATVEDVYSKANELLGEYFRDHNLKLVVKVLDTELELIEWCIRKIHKHKTDFVGIWNMGFDVPTILDRLKVLGVDPKTVFCDNTLPENYQVCDFHVDNRKNVQHIVEKWHWFNCTAHAQWIDLMALFARIRKREPKRSSYALDNITKEEIKDEKLHVPAAGHYEMQTRRFVEYVVYNIKDSLLLYMMEKQNNDVSNFHSMTSGVRLADFNKQTVMLVCNYQRFLLANGYVCATTGKNMEGQYDFYITKHGGAVADARNAREIGAKCLLEDPSYYTNIMPFGADQDFASMYPNIKEAAGICKEGKLATVVQIKLNDNCLPIEPYMSAIAAPRENAVWLGSTYYNLPNHMQMAEIISEMKTKRNAA